MSIKHIPQSVYRRFFQKKIEDGYGDKSWSEYLSFLAKDFTVNPSIADVFKESHEILLKMWMKNFADNLPNIREKRLCLSELEADEPTKPRPAVVVGRGPSLFANDHISLLRDFRGKIVATDGTLIHLLEQDVVPTLTLTVDGSSLIKKWYNHPLVTEHASELDVALSVTVDHQVYKHLHSIGCKIFWYYPLFDDYRNYQSFTNTQMLMTSSDNYKKPLQLLRCGGNAGTASWMVALKILKCAPISLIGIDFGYPEGTRLEATPYFSTVMDAINTHFNGNTKILDSYYEKIYHPDFGTNALMDLVFKQYRSKFLEFVLATPKWHQNLGGTFNCTEGGTLFGPGLTCKPFKDFLHEYS